MFRVKYNFVSNPSFLLSSVSTNDFESYMNEEKREDLLSKCMQSMSIEEQGENI